MNRRIDPHHTPHLHNSDPTMAHAVDTRRWSLVPNNGLMTNEQKRYYV